MTDTEEFSTNLASQSIAFQNLKPDPISNGMPGITASPAPTTASTEAPTAPIIPPTPEPTITLDTVYLFLEDAANKQQLTSWKLHIDQPQNVVVFYQLELHGRDLPRFSKALRLEHENASSRWVKATIFLGERRMTDDFVKIILGRVVLEDMADLERLLQHVERFPMDGKLEGSPLKDARIDQGVNTMPIMFHNGSMSLFEPTEPPSVTLPPSTLTPVAPRGRRGRKKGFSPRRAQTISTTMDSAGAGGASASSNRVTRSTNRVPVVKTPALLETSILRDPKRFHCNQCDKSYTALHNLRAHTDKSHPYAAGMPLMSSEGLGIRRGRGRGRGGRGRGRRGRGRGRKRAVPPALGMGGTPMAQVVVPVLNGMEESAAESEPRGSQGEEVTNTTVEAMDIAPGSSSAGGNKNRHPCQYCEKSYTQRHNLTTHQKKCHPVEYAFPDSVSAHQTRGASGSSGSGLGATSAAGDGTPKYSCQHCARQFDRAQTLKFHLIRAHPQEEAKRNGLDGGDDDGADAEMEDSQEGGTEDRSQVYEFEDANG